MDDYGKRARPAAAPGTHRPPRTARRARPSSERCSAHGGNVAAVGRELGKARMQIHRWMKRYGIEVEDYRG